MNYKMQICENDDQAYYSILVIFAYSYKQG